MKRSIKSEQRAVRQLHFTCSADGLTLSGLDAKKVSMADTGTGIKTITLDQAFASADYVVQVTSGTALTVANAIITDSGVFVVDSITASTGAAVDSIVHVTVTGSDVTDRY
jgi:hypothetical protein